MVKEIAVFLGAEGASISLSEPGKVTVYCRGWGCWEVGREIEFSIGHAKGMSELRQCMREMLQFLADCKIFVARSATGVPYFELEKAGCSVWEISGRPEEFLDQVWQDEEREKATLRSEASATMPVPEETAPGHYFISIKEIQEKTAEVSSKQVLRQFIRSGTFRTLTIKCSHVPPWLDVEAAGCGLGCEAEQLGKNEFKVRVTKKVAEVP